MLFSPGVVMIPAIFLVLFSTAVWAAEEVTVERVSSEVVDGACYVDARINFNLHDDLLEALDHGVELDGRASSSGSGKSASGSGTGSTRRTS